VVAFDGRSSVLPVFEITSDDWNDISADCMRQHMREEDLSLKELAGEIGCNVRTAENYVQGRNSPGGINMLRCLATNPIFRGQGARVTGMAGDLDPRAMHQAMKVMQEASRFLDAMGASAPAFVSTIRVWRPKRPPMTSRATYSNAWGAPDAGSRSSHCCPGETSSICRRRGSRSAGRIALGLGKNWSAMPARQT
jgi:hypothetical protein